MSAKTTRPSASLLLYSAIFNLVYASYVGEAAAQDYPSRPIRVIVPGSPGSGSDTVARILSPEVAKSLGQALVVENKPGANAALGAEYVARHSPADGYTIAVVVVTEMATLPVTVKDLRFDPVKDLPPVIGLVEAKSVLLSSSRHPWKTFNELVIYAKANPNKLNAGATGPLLRLQSEAISRAFGLEVTQVPYALPATYFQAMTTGEVHLGFLSEPTVVSMGEKVRALAVTGRNRTPSFPEAPTFAEIGYPEMPGPSYSLNARAGTPKAVVDKLYTAASRALQQPEVSGRLTKLRFEIINETGNDAAKRLANVATLFSDIAKKAGIAPQ